MENSKSPRSIGLLRFVAAAAVILLVGMVVLYYQVSQQNKDLASANKALTERVNQDDVVLDRIKVEQTDVGNAIVVNMVGTRIAPKSSANVYWDSTNSKVYLVVKNMPQLASDKQYQLWALIDNKQKSLGVFDATDKNIILKMDSTKKAQAFAITIEKKGGNPTPTLDSLTSIGKTQLIQ
jgi:anti-sigma-K factor RskA